MDDETGETVEQAQWSKRNEIEKTASSAVQLISAAPPVTKRQGFDKGSITIPMGP